MIAKDLMPGAGGTWNAQGVVMVYDGCYFSAFNSLYGTLAEDTMSAEHSQEVPYPRSIVWIRPMIYH